MRLLIGITVMMLTVIVPAYALEEFRPSDIEMRALPPYCTARIKMNQDSAEYQVWQSRLGPDFLHVHHYCFGLNFTNRYYRATALQDKRFNIQNAINNFNYMIEHARPEFILMPDIYVDRGRVYLLMDKTALAIGDFEKALSVNPRSLRAYYALADYYVSNKQSKEALDMVTEGLRHVPSSKGLQNRYKELGGKMPFPEAYQDASSAVTATQPTAGGSENDSKPQGVVDPGKDKPTDAEAKPPIGEPGNPWCRFCPKIESSQKNPAPANR